MTDDELFLTAILDCTRSDLYVHPPTLTVQQQTLLETMRARRLAGEPVQYITGFTEFMGYRCEVGPGVLVPRPETEILADTAIRALKVQGVRAPLILDLGTGSGCLAIAMARLVSGSRVLAVDISPQALAYARRNAALNAVSDAIEFIEGDMQSFLEGTALCFDAIVANPPYIPSRDIPSLPADVRCEPVLSLDGGADGLACYRMIVPAAFRRLTPGGILSVEFGDGQDKDLQNCLASTGAWDRIQVHDDNAGRPRVITAQRPV